MWVLWGLLDWITAFTAESKFVGALRSGDVILEMELELYTARLMSHLTPYC